MIFVFDIGGTMIKYGIFDEGLSHDQCVHSDEMPSDALLGGTAMLSGIIGKIEALKETFALDGISISTAGQIDSTKGTVVFATESIPNYTGTNIKAILNAAFHVPIRVENDVNCCLLGELYLNPEINKADPIVALTLGTGIGGALYLGNRLYSGHHFSAGEMGHMQMVKDGLPCSCGQRGCFEQYASTQALKKSVEKQLGLSDLKQFFDLCRASDAVALEVLDQWTDCLTDGLKNIVHMINPKCILIGGGIAAQGVYLEKKITAALLPKLMPSYRETLRIVVMQSGNRSNLYGAYYNYLLGQMQNGL